MTPWHRWEDNIKMDLKEIKCTVWTPMIGGGGGGEEEEEWQTGPTVYHRI